MTLFGKDPEYLEVVTAEFLPDGSKLYILVADSDCNLHVLQYDPEGTYYPSLPIFIPLGSSGRSKKKKKTQLTLPTTIRPQILQRRSPVTPQQILHRQLRFSNDPPPTHGRSLRTPRSIR